MKVLGRILLFLLVVVVLAGVIAYADGASLPVNHTVSVESVVPAAPEKVFDIIANVADGASWRPAVKSVTMLTPEDGPDGKEDHWTEDLGHGQKMTFVAVQSRRPIRRDVLLDDPNASYGGAWIYELSPGPSPGTTDLRITESGFIHPPLYRFMMVHIFGPAHNLNQYMNDIKGAAGKS
jgi:Polyketide cyclase / dehydrase and lipid transport